VRSLGLDGLDRLNGLDGLNSRVGRGGELLLRWTLGRGATDDNVAVQDQQGCCQQVQQVSPDANSCSANPTQEPQLLTNSFPGEISPRDLFSLSRELDRKGPRVANWQRQASAKAKAATPKGEKQGKAGQGRARQPLEADAAVDVAVWLGSVAKCAGWRPRWHWPGARAGGEDASERPYHANVAATATAGKHTTRTYLQPHHNNWDRWESEGRGKNVEGAKSGDLSGIPWPGPR
jgi:hypothetical protein